VTNWGRGRPTDMDHAFAKRRAFLQPGAFTERRRDPGRVAWVETMQCALFLSVIVTHAAMPYRVTETPVLHADPTALSYVFTAIASALGFVQMHALFFVAGITSAMVLNWEGRTQYVRQIVTRFAIPLVAVVLLLNVSQDWFTYAMSTVGVPDGRHYFMTWLPRHWLTGNGFGHLWFLVLAVLLSCALTPFRALLVREDLSSRLRVIRTRIALMLLAVLVAVAPVAVAAAGIQVPTLRYAGTMNMPLLTALATYGAFFAMGALLQRLPSAFAAFAAPTVQETLGGAAALIGALSITMSDLPALRPLAMLLHGVAAVAAVRVLSALSRRWLSHPPALMQRVRCAAFTMFLTHHVVVVLMVFALRSVGLPSVIKFALVLSAAAGVSFAFHEWVVARFPLVAFVLNGAPMPTHAKQMKVPRESAYTPIALTVVTRRVPKGFSA
jgi:glucans biosynthesis protein C